jgi:hypothetical protein
MALGEAGRQKGICHEDAGNMPAQALRCRRQDIPEPVPLESTEVLGPKEKLPSAVASRNVAADQ